MFITGGVIMGLGIISLFFLLAFSALYAEKSIQKRPAFLSKAAAKVAENVDALSFWGFVYALAALILTPLFLTGGFTVMIMVLSNMFLLLMVLPFTLDRLVETAGDKIPGSLASEFRQLVEGISRREKIMAYAGAGMAFLLFAVLTA